MRSSNSSGGDPRGFSHFLGRALTLLADEIPWAYARVATSLDGREVLLTIDNDVVAVKSSHRAVRLGPASERPDVVLQSSREAILDMAVQGVSLVDSVLADRVILRGRVDDLVAFHDGLIAFLHGAVRSPSFPGLLSEYRSER